MYSLQLCLLALLVCNVFSSVLQANPPVVKTTNTKVKVSWMEIENPNPTDLITFHTAAQAPSNDTLLGQFSVTSSDSWKNGYGNVEFNLVNIRQDVVFTYMSINSDYQWKIVIVSNVVSLSSTEPTQGHLALTSNPSEMRLMWVSGSNAYQPTVQYGTVPGNLDKTVYGTSSTYTNAQLCTAPANSSANGAWIDPGYQHDVVLTNLSLNTKYYYRFGNDQEGWSPVTSFVSSPGVGPDIHLNFVMFGDMGVETPFNHSAFFDEKGVEQQTMAPKSLKWIKRYIDQHENEPKLILDVGDISYARGYAVLWDYYMESIAPFSTKAPWMVTIGNHEYDYPGQEFRPSWSGYGLDSLGECGVPYSNRFNMPGPTYKGLRNLWYSFEMGPIHFCVMSAEHDFLTGSEQWNWLKNDLESVDRSRTPWIIFLGHRPFYTSSGTDILQGMSIHLREHVEPLLLKNKVDLVLVGHMHKYERMCGFTNNLQCAERDEDGVVHIVVGTAGNVYQEGWDDNQFASHKHQPDWSVFRTDAWGISELSVNGTHLEFVYYDDQRGEIHDRLVLYKPNRE